MEGKTLNLKYKDKESLRLLKRQIQSKISRIIYSKYKKFIFEVNFDIKQCDKNFTLLIDKHYDFSNSNKDKAFSSCLRLAENTFLALITKFNKENLLIKQRNNEIKFKQLEVNKENILPEVSSLCDKVYNA